MCFIKGWSSFLPETKPRYGVQELVRNWQMKGKPWKEHLALADAGEGDDTSSKEISSDDDAQVFNSSPRRRQSLLTLDEDSKLLKIKVHSPLVGGFVILTA